MRFLTLLVMLVLFSSIFPMPAQATTVSNVVLVGDRYWQVLADMREPLDGVIYYTPGSQNYAGVPHGARYESRIDAAYQGGITVRHFYTFVGNMERWDAGQQFLRVFQDTIFAMSRPQVIPAYWSSYKWGNPSQTGVLFDYCVIGPANSWHYADARAESIDHDLGYMSLSVMDRVYYKVRQ